MNLTHTDIKKLCELANERLEGSHFQAWKRHGKGVMFPLAIGRKDGDQLFFLPEELARLMGVVCEKCKGVGGVQGTPDFPGDNRVVTMMECPECGGKGVVL